MTELTAHDQLLARARELASTIAGIEPTAIAALRALYTETDGLSGDEAYLAEIASHDRWMAEHFDASSLAERRAGIIERGSKQG